jgi:serine/threonine protein kinase
LSYIAPEEIELPMIERGMYPAVDALKTEVFSMGMTILMAASLRDSYYLYDRKLLHFSSAKKQERMTEISVIYSPYFCSLLGSMLEEDAAKRRSSDDIFRELNRYEDDILSLRKF